ncbi:glycosyltransferase [Trinickia diaoshuihuensis]|uniref:glycosyltransferase n=1 Tax=Trinickia diaoshuihuensis TaxID=2292265 RepID=UPI000E233502|nr:glycosyltransferase [Trinickia diaoshuihuensis]
MEAGDITENSDLLLCIPAGWDAYISREFYEIHQRLATLGWKVMVVGEDEDNCILAAAREARVVLLWECYEIMERHAERFAALPTQVKRIAFCDDVHYFSEYRRAQRQRAFRWADLILATYPHKLIEWFPEIKKDIRWVPHSAASYFSPIFAPASDRVLLSGARTWPYPFRQFCAEKLSCDVCDVVDHPGYPGYPGDKNNKMKVNASAFSTVGAERYASLLRRYPAMLVCGSVFSYLVAKVFEGMASGCLIVADRTSLGAHLSALGLQEGQHYLGTDVLHVAKDAAEVQQIYRNDNDRWAMLTMNAAHEVARRHTTTIRAREIHELCTSETRN